MTDQVDSVNIVLNDSGLIVSQVEFLPFGETWTHEGDMGHAAKYNSQELDKETNYYFYNARHYDPEVCRFVTADTVIPYEIDTQSWNRFSYVRNNPILYKDPTGHEEKTAMQVIRDPLESFGNLLQGNGWKTERQHIADLNAKLQQAKTPAQKFKNQMVDNLRGENGAFTTVIGNTDVTLALGSGKSFNDAKKAIEGLSNKSVSVLADLAREFDLSKMTITSLTRTPYNGIQTDPHRFEDSPLKNPGGGKGIDITRVTSRLEKYRNDNNGTTTLQDMPGLNQPKEPGMASDIMDHLKSDKRVNQAFSPWQIYSNIPGWWVGSDDNRWRSAPGIRDNLDQQHNNHLHIGTK